MSTDRYTDAADARAARRHDTRRAVVVRRRAALADYRAELAAARAVDTEAEAPATEVATEAPATWAPTLAPAPGPLAYALAELAARPIVDGAAAAPGGGSLPTESGAAVPAAGYVVGGVVPSLMTDAAPTLAEVTAWILDTDAPRRADVVGWWTDTVTGRVYVDASDVVTGRADALKLAAARGELAVWDLAAGCEVRTEAARI